MNQSPQTVKDVGEHGLLQRLKRFCPADIVGDDGAIVALKGDGCLVVTTDLLVDNVHFSDRTTTAEDAGWRAAAANLSDLAAMGASPLGITVGLALRGDLALDWVEGFYQGLSLCLTPYDIPILGGDICRSEVITVSITAFGEVRRSHAITRSAAQPGDAIVVTGYHGSSRAGLELLLAPQKGQHLNPQAREFLLRAHQRPQPRLDLLPHLLEIVKENSVAGMDSSDGLADAIMQICQCSNLSAQIDLAKIPLHPALLKLASPEQALEWALYGGEDFELVLCLPQPHAVALVAKLGDSAAIIGKITTEKPIQLQDSQGKYAQQPLDISQRFQHF
ncbi:MAG: thiamine-phosphate kinase [Oscillatoria sp. PMC 1076.18]|nr:thiamine-phosphate kinase [Oscillatoria sp. PMC 1076.18]